MKRKKTIDLNCVIVYVCVCGICMNEHFQHHHFFLYCHHNDDDDNKFQL